MSIPVLVQDYLVVAYVVAGATCTLTAISGFFFFWGGGEGVDKDHI